VPTYLIAIAAGNLKYKPFSPPPGKTWKMGIWAELEVLEAADWEFKEDAPKSVDQIVVHTSHRAHIDSWFRQKISCSLITLVIMICWFYHPLSHMAAWCV
jgi:hypothetical protein